MFVIFYSDFDGDKITICNSADFERFLGYNINKVHVACKRGPRSKEINEKPKLDVSTNGDERGQTSSGHVNREPFGGMAGTSTQNRNVDSDSAPSNDRLTNIFKYDSDNSDDNNEDNAMENVRMDPNASVVESVAIMIDMGYENDDNWLDDVLQLTQGDISEVIEFLTPQTIDQ